MSVLKHANDRMIYVKMANVQLAYQLIFCVSHKNKMLIYAVGTNITRVIQLNKGKTTED
jgi:hypothetical protein